VFGIAATFLTIGLGYLAVTLYGFFNPAFRALDRSPGEPVEPVVDIS
jgi:hypothetical protein